MAKKAQGISINVIVVAAIALIVLLVLSFVLFGRFQIFGKGLQSCKGVCVENAACPSDRPVAIPSDSGCVSQVDNREIQPGDNKRIVCCVNPLSQ